MKIEAPRGTLDVLPSEQPTRDAIVDAAEDTAWLYGYGRIITPTFEDTELFARTSGQGSDVVTKEMYTFRDRSDRSLTLRPEATAGICRAFAEHGLHRLPQPVKTFTVAQMFRYAAPQKGRYREFWQVDFEAVGSDDPAVDAELIQLFAEIERRLGIETARLELNSIGDRTCRPAYVERLGAWLAEHDAELDDDAREKARTSPLRVFDTKSARVREALRSAPTIGESLCADCRDHFSEVRAFLDAYRIEYELVPTLVRGLDYYTRTVWEFVDDGLGAAQSSICAGGRYDYLVEEIGGPPTPAVGWAAGIERLRMSMRVEPEPSRLDVFFAFEDRARRPEVVPFMADLRAEGISCDTDYAGRSLKGQLTQAQRRGARRVAIVPAAGDRWTVREAGQLDREVPQFETSAFVS
jgi:histidyl-tRNA synthetase